MDELSMVKEEAEVADDPPQPMAGLHDLGPPAFLIKTFEMLEDPETDAVVSWSSAKNSFIVWDSYKFSTTLLPKYFKHSNFSSFIRQLNTYGFRKVDPDRWEFANDKFLNGQKHLLKEIKRRRNVGQTSQQQNPSGTRLDRWSRATGRPCVEIGRFGLELEADRLRRDRRLLIAEISKLRQQHQNSLVQLMAMEERIEGTERKQRNAMAFLARALKNPIFIQQLVRKRRSKKMRSAALELEAMLGTEKERGSNSSVESSGAVFDAYREEVSEMSNVMWELLNEGLEVTGAGGGAEPEANIKAESFEEDSGHWNDEVQGFVRDFASFE